MRLSDFWRNMENEFGPRYSHVLADTLSLTEFDSLTASAALARGVKPRDVFFAVCRAQDVPEERWLGLDLEPKDSNTSN